MCLWGRSWKSHTKSMISVWDLESLNTDECFSWKIIHIFPTHSRTWFFIVTQMVYNIFWRLIFIYSNWYLFSLPVLKLLVLISVVLIFNMRKCIILLPSIYFSCLHLCWQGRSVVANNVVLWSWLFNWMWEVSDLYEYLKVWIHKNKIKFCFLLVTKRVLIFFI